jgi:hypothetical protein
MTRYENFVKENKAEAPKPKVEKVPVKTENNIDAIKKRKSNDYMQINKDLRE